MKRQESDFPKREAQRRFEVALRAALNTPPKPLKSMTPKGVRAQRKKPSSKAKDA
jgi:hypothetical protein